MNDSLDLGHTATPPALDSLYRHAERILEQKSQPETYADRVVKALEVLGFRAAFGIPGGAICTIFNSLSRSTAIRTTLCQHECGAAYMALGRSLCSRGRDMGLCFATAGPGITNLITGVAAAYEERVPIFVLTGNVATTLAGKGAAQDSYSSGIDVVKMLEPVTARSMTVFEKKDIVPAIIELHRLAIQTKRPVHLNVPIDLASAPFDVNESDNPEQKVAIEVSPPPAIDTTEFKAAALTFMNAQRPLIFAGHGIKSSGYDLKLRQLAELLDLPVVVTSHAKGILPDDHPYYFGTFGFASTERSVEFIKAYQPDAILFLGTRLGECASAGWSSILSNPAIRIQVDIDESQFNKNYSLTHAIKADLNDFMSAMLSLEPETVSRQLLRRSEIIETHRTLFVHSDETPSMTGKARPKDLVRVLDFWLPDNAIIFSDIGTSMAWLINELSIRHAQEFYVPIGLGAMGSGLCGAIGAKSAVPHRPVICLTGDCTTLMHGTELFTAANAGIGVKVIILNDGGHGMVDHGMRILGLNDSNLRFKSPLNFKTFGDFLGVESYRVENLRDMVRLPMDELFASPNPVLFDVAIDPTPVPPITGRTQVLSKKSPGE